jgi:hypothetical protein
MLAFGPIGSMPLADAGASGGVGASTVTGVTVSPGAANGSTTFSATVAGTNLP